ncbi:MAG: hypothetical protein JO061_00650 [Acidobacteriaceae bacterium]|nr:hypothetical protein [Acidobacteriaceae bacterium]
MPPRMPFTLPELPQWRDAMRTAVPPLLPALQPVPRKRTPNPASKTGWTEAPQEFLPDGSIPMARQIFAGQNHPKNRKKLTHIDQWVEIRIEEGKTTTRLYPPNDQLIEEAKEMLPPPDLVYRRLNFVDGVPPEYEWAIGKEDADVRERGGCGIQRMTADTWLQVIAREKLRDDGHIGRTGVGNIPRPDGKCDCPVCTANKGLLDAVLRAKV